MAATTTEQGTYQGKTASQWREMAAEAGRSRAESWERSDTDGFLSQWGHQMMQDQYLTSAELAENDGWAEFCALFDTDGNLLDAEIRPGKYGSYWLIRGLPAGVKPFFTESGAKKGARRYATDTAKGYRLGTVRRKGYVRLSGESMTSVRVVVVPDRYSDAVEIIDNGTAMTWYQDH